ncbi:hypothetical protein Pla22_08950 [Rubripirellula amarantea]|uniref:Uncharacterized protein n=2 Tax=Rubripirellula amarantea TaxID=2527999 RepID=A0A5C5WRT7_9BACT|nr:hypothetical protein Pla22_08950 [Rubripirellula amarantea]
MAKGRKKRSAIELGHDAFLDIVANLVGILIILVVVLGAQSTAVIEQVTEDEDATVVNLTNEEFATDQQLEVLAGVTMRAAAAQADSNRLERLVTQYDAELEARMEQRGMLMDLLSEAQAAWQAKQRDLDQDKLAAAKLQTELEITEQQLAQIRGERERIEGEPAPVVAVAHLPTPMAKTVFGEEIHLRLKDNRLSVVPLERLLEEIKDDLQRAMNGSRNGEIDGAVGPVRGYVARYAMDKSQGLISRGGTAQMATRVQLVGLMLEPMSEPYGQEIEKVFAGKSELDIELAGRDPNTTTITVWVYPDSFASFRRLKEVLYTRGFATAARPLPQNAKITGSANGSRSDAQ